MLQLPFSPTPKKLAKLGMALALGAALGPYQCPKFGAPMRYGTPCKRDPKKGP